MPECPDYVCETHFTDTTVVFPACCDIYWHPFDVCEGEYRLTGLLEYDEPIQGIRWLFDVNGDGDSNDEGEWNNILTYWSFYEPETAYGGMWNMNHFIEIGEVGTLWVGVYLMPEGGVLPERDICLDRID